MCNKLIPNILVGRIDLGAACFLLKRIDKAMKRLSPIELMQIQNTLFIEPLTFGKRRRKFAT